MLALNNGRWLTLADVTTNDVPFSPLNNTPQTEISSRHETELRF